MVGSVMEISNCIDDVIEQVETDVMDVEVGGLILGTLIFKMSEEK
jgi:hypothetical protein